MAVIDKSIKLKGTDKVKHHPQWRKEPHPWGGFPAKASNHPSIEQHYLYRTAKRLGGNIANLGTWRGVSAACLTHGVKDHGEGKVYAIDYYTKSKPHSPEKLAGLFEERGILPYVEFCKGTTLEWAEKLKHLQFNFVFIDADHRYEPCKADFEAWSQLLAPGGEIAFHDIRLNTVNKVIEELDGWRQIDHVYGIKTFKKEES